MDSVSAYHPCARGVESLNAGKSSSNEGSPASLKRTVHDHPRRHLVRRRVNLRGVNRAGGETKDAEDMKKQGWAVQIKRNDGTVFLACSSPGFLPAVWDKRSRRFAREHKTDLTANKFDCKVVAVEYTDPVVISKLSAGKRKPNAPSDQTR